MKNYTLPLALVICINCILIACTPKPEKYFDTAILNCNTISGFGNGQLEYELKSPSVRLVEGTKDQTEVMKRVEVINEKIQQIESNLADIKHLKETEDAKDILKTSIALHEFVLPVYKNEYLQVAQLYDKGSPKEQIDSLKQSIYSKYSATYAELFDKVTNAGKAYATKHNINVNWGIKTSPDL